MKQQKRTYMFLALGLVLAPCAVRAQTRNVTLTELDGLVGRWMGLRTTIAEEKREWQTQREQWEAELRLLEQEALALTKQIEEGSGEASNAEADRAQILAHTESMEAALDKTRRAIAQAEDELRVWQRRIPGALARVAGIDFRTLPASQEAADRTPLTKRTQVVVALFSQIETLQNSVHTTRELLSPAQDSGARRQYDVLYIGLARAFAVSPDNTLAAVGTPENDAWTWETRNTHAAAFRQAHDTATRKTPARLLTLPMRVTAGGEK